MKLKANTWYRTRSGDLAYVDKITNYYSTWPWRGLVKEAKEAKEEEVSWTEFGGVSSLYNDFGGENPLYYDPYDLVKEITKEDYPEVYL